jgi:hypothetical protein
MTDINPGEAIYVDPVFMLHDGCTENCSYTTGNDCYIAMF